MPACVLGIPTTLQEFSPQREKYDLIVMGYQAWFLSPSIPNNSLLEHPAFKKLLVNTPVVTVTGARNMWISASERIKLALKKTGALHAGNVALVDRHANFISFITIFYWMLTAKKEKFLNLFPVPGVSKEDISNSARFGAIVQKHLEDGSWENLQNDLVKNKAVVIKYNLMFIESKARKIFGIWAGIISRKKNRGPWLTAFKYYLMIALFVAAPIILTVDAIFFRPFLQKRIKNQKLRYAGVN
jgi:hypothetical protein